MNMKKTFLNDQHNKDIFNSFDIKYKVLSPLSYKFSRSIISSPGYKHGQSQNLKYFLIFDPSQIQPISAWKSQTSL